MEECLPPEVLAHVLSFVLQDYYVKREEYYDYEDRHASYLNSSNPAYEDEVDEEVPLDACDKVTPIVCRFVCRRWNQAMLDLAVPQAPNPYKRRYVLCRRRPQLLDGLEEDLVAQAAGRGWLSVVRWLLVNRCRANCILASHAAARGGHGKVLAWLRRAGADRSLPWQRYMKDVWDEATCALAARGGHMRVVQWLRDNRCPWNQKTVTEAARAGHFELVKWLRANGCSWSRATCAGAARGGHKAILEWLRKPRVMGWATVGNMCDWDQTTCSAAALGGRLDILQWARANGCAWDQETCLLAAKHGHLEVLQWARANGCPWNDTQQAAVLAARAGHIHILHWLVDQCQLHLEPKLYIAAAKGRQMEVMMWLHDNECGPTDDGQRAILIAARLGQEKMVGWLHEHGLPLTTEVCREAARGGHLEIIKWARAYGVPWSAEVCSGAAEGGHWALLRWLRANGCPWDRTTLDGAMEADRADIARWAGAAGCPGWYPRFVEDYGHCLCSCCCGSDRHGYVDEDEESMMPGKDMRHYSKGHWWSTRRSLGWKYSEV